MSTSTGRTVCHVVEHDDRIVIQTTARRAEAILLVLSGSTLADVARRFGISRERVRQFVANAGLNIKQRILFSDTATQRHLKRRFVARSRRRVVHRQRTRRRMAEVSAWLRAFAATNGCSPSYQQVVDHLELPSLSGLLVYLGHTGNRYTTRQAMRRLHLVYRMAGIEPRARGANGHLDGGASAIAGLRRYREAQRVAP